MLKLMEHEHDFEFEKYVDIQKKVREGYIIEELSELLICACGEKEISHVLYKNEFSGI